MKHLRLPFPLVFALVSAIGLAACSSVAPHPDLTTTLIETRVAGGTQVSRSDRMRLPATQSIFVQDQADEAGQRLNAAALRGLARAFRVDAERPDWRLVVHWPEGRWHGPDADPGESVALHRLLHAPADRTVIAIDLYSGATDEWLDRVHLRLKPWLMGGDWHDPRTLERAFAALAEDLTGTGSR